MYRVYDKEEATRQVQIYLAIVTEDDIFIAPTGVYDENTKLAVTRFQTKNNINPSGIVDYETFTLLYEDYRIKNDILRLKKTLDSFITFPLYPGRINPAMMHINRTLARLLDYYGYTHSLSDSNFYSNQTTKAVEILREIYLLPEANYIDEILYMRMIADHDSISRTNIL